jgi:hypothetical protein
MLYIVNEIRVKSIVVTATQDASSFATQKPSLIQKSFSLFRKPPGYVSKYENRS